MVEASSGSRADRTDPALVLSVVADLAQHLSDLEIDVVDGEMFFRTFPGFATRIAEARELLSGWDEADPRDPRWAVITALEKRLGLVQPGVVDHVLLGRRLRMRGPEVEFRYSLDLGRRTAFYDRVRVDVRSGDWRGEDLARCVQEWSGPRHRYLRRSKDLNRGKSEKSYAFSPAGLYQSPEGVVFRPAFISVEFSLPSPSTRSIAAYYEDIREGTNLHRRLPSTAKRVTPLVRVRTWGIGLLMGAGISFDRAWSGVAAMLGVPEDTLTQEADRQCRKRLMVDVPEARGRLTARRFAR